MAYGWKTADECKRLLQCNASDCFVCWGIAHLWSVKSVLQTQTQCGWAAPRQICSQGQRDQQGPTIRICSCWELYSWEYTQMRSQGQRDPLQNLLPVTAASLWSLWCSREYYGKFLIKMLIICRCLLKAQSCLKWPILDCFRICKFALKRSKLVNVQILKPSQLVNV